MKDVLDFKARGEVFDQRRKEIITHGPRRGFGKLRKNLSGTVALHRLAAQFSNGQTKNLEFLLLLLASVYHGLLDTIKVAPHLSESDLIMNRGHLQ
jgi:hypothetical protein